MLPSVGIMNAMSFAEATRVVASRCFDKLSF